MDCEPFPFSFHLTVEPKPGGGGGHCLEGCGAMTMATMASILAIHFSSERSSLGLTKEKPANAVWSMESMRFLSA